MSLITENLVIIAGRIYLTSVECMYLSNTTIFDGIYIYIYIYTHIYSI